MSDKKLVNTNQSEVALNEDRGLSPTSSGTPMPTVKPAATPVTSQKPQSDTGKK